MSDTEAETVGGAEAETAAGEVGTSEAKTAEGEVGTSCSVCGKPTTLRCPCETAWYSDKACQKLDWKERGHKAACKKIRAARAPPVGFESERVPRRLFDSRASRGSGPGAARETARPPRATAGGREYGLSTHVPS